MFRNWLLNSNLTINVHCPSALDNNNDNIIENCKYICKKVTPLTPFFLIGDNSGKGIFIGFTYNNIPNYACILYISINTSKCYYCNCYDNEWVIY